MLKFVKRLLCCVIVLLLGFGALVTLLGYREYRTLLDEKPLASVVAETREKESFTPLYELPKTYRDAVVAAEDHRFRLHFGIDPLGIARALMVDLRDKEFKEGGSTITQQLAKNYYFPMNRDLIKKIAEAFIAVRLEKDYTKDDILELYVNTIYFGDGYYSVRDAALGYFDKKPSQLSDYECTMLAGIPNAPSAYAPTKNPDLAEQRRKIVVRKMLNEGYLGEEEANILLQAS
ncbi:MAG: transglycosylase domain-containing protein [Oscillospiraceae bacterium]|nr:transglycosylase domain-containing protein [Oscillospiraceae bacterium]